MAHYAKVTNSLVTRVIVAEAEFFDTFVDSSPGEWIQTSYSGSIRKNYAGVGYTYDVTRDAFYAPQPYASWTLVEATCQWTAPIFTMITINTTWRAKMKLAAQSTQMTRHRFKKIKRMMTQNQSRPQGSSLLLAVANLLGAIILKWRTLSFWESTPNSRASALQKCYSVGMKNFHLRISKKKL